MDHLTASDSILGLKLRTIYPEMAKELSKHRRLSDISLIQDIIKTHYKVDQEKPSRGRLIFMAAIVNLYDPDVLDGWKRNLNGGIRQQLAKLYGVSPTAISNNIKIAQNYMLIYKKFNENVERLSDEIAAVYSQKENKS